MKQNLDFYSDDCDLEAALAGGVADAATRYLLDLLRQRRAGFKAELDRGVAPDEFKLGQEALGAYDAAILGLEAARDRRRKG